MPRSVMVLVLQLALRWAVVAAWVAQWVQFRGSWVLPPLASVVSTHGTLQLQQRSSRAENAHAELRRHDHVLIAGVLRQHLSQDGVYSVLGSHHQAAFQWMKLRPGWSGWRA